MKVGCIVVVGVGHVRQLLAASRGDVVYGGRAPVAQAHLPSRVAIVAGGGPRHAGGRPRRLHQRRRTRPPPLSVGAFCYVSTIIKAARLKSAFHVVNDDGVEIFARSFFARTDRNPHNAPRRRCWPRLRPR